jgi:hypothetical protein
MCYDFLSIRLLITSISQNVLASRLAFATSSVAEFLSSNIYTAKEKVINEELSYYCSCVILQTAGVRFNQSGWTLLLKQYFWCLQTLNI